MFRRLFESCARPRGTAGRRARRLLDAVAVVPPHVERPLLDRLVPNADAALDECTTAGMLRADARRVGFRHELARIAVEDTLPPGSRRTLHRGCLRRSSTRAATSTRLASPTTPRRLRTPKRSCARPRGGRAGCSGGSHREAADQYARALRHDADVEPAVRAGWLVRRAISCYLTDQNAEALAALRVAAALYHELGDAVAEGTR